MRKHDSEQPPQFRAQDRVYSLNGQWYFQTREDDHGPYVTRAAARTALARYIAEMNDLANLEKPRAKHTPHNIDALVSRKPS